MKTKMPPWALNDAWYCTQDQWGSAFLQLVNDGWRWHKSWRLWIPSKSADGLRQIDAVIRAEMADAFRARRRIVLVTDGQFDGPWSQTQEVEELRKLTFAAFSASSTGAATWSQGARVPKGPRLDAGYGLWLCAEAPSQDGATWYWAPTVLDGLADRCRTNLPDQSLSFEAIQRVIYLSLARGQIDQLERFIVRTYNSQDQQFAAFAAVREQLHERAAEWERQASTMVPLRDFWRGDAGFYVRSAIEYVTSALKGQYRVPNAD